EIELKPVQQVAVSADARIAAKPRLASVRWTSKARGDALAHAVLILGAALMAFPIYLAFVASTHTLSETLTGLPFFPGDRLLDNYRQVLSEGLRNYGLPPIWPMLVNSIVVALVVALGEIAVAIPGGVAVGVLRFRFRLVAF